jgi:hypothetical protein
MGLTPPRDWYARLKLSPQILYDARRWAEQARKRTEARAGKEA